MAKFLMMKLPFSGSRQDTREMEFIYTNIYPYVSNTSDGTAELVLAFATGSMPGLSRSFMGAVENLGPQEAVVLVVKGDPTVNNTLQVDTDSNLKLHPSYSGVAYDLGGPSGADITTSPIMLGFRKGDRIKLSGSVGTEPNPNKEFTLDHPSRFSIMETLSTPDANTYNFTVFRRLR